MKIHKRKPSRSLASKKRATVTINLKANTVTFASPVQTVTAGSSRLARTMFKRIALESATYRKNMQLLRSNDERENELAASTSGMSLPDLQAKYKVKARAS